MIDAAGVGNFLSLSNASAYLTVCLVMRFVCFTSGLRNSDHLLNEQMATDDVVFTVGPYS